MKRLFIAIHIQPQKPLLALLDQFKRKLMHERINWVKPENLHMTLKFLGETSEQNIPSIVEHINVALDGRPGFMLQFDKTGVFGSRYDPKVIWVGSQQANVAINTLANSVLDASAAAGFPRDRQNFVPHLTLGRIKGLNDKAHFQRVMQDIPQQLFQTSEVDQLVLFESILRKEGPQYIPLHRFEMQGVKG